MRRAAAASALGVAIAALELRLRGETDVRTQVVGQLAAFALFLPAAWLCWRGLRIGRGAGPNLSALFLAPYLLAEAAGDGSDCKIRHRVSCLRRNAHGRHR